MYLFLFLVFIRSGVHGWAPPLEEGENPGKEVEGGPLARARHDVTSTSYFFSLELRLLISGTGINSGLILNFEL